MMLNMLLVFSRPRGAQSGGYPWGSAGGAEIRSDMLVAHTYGERMVNYNAPFGAILDPAPFRDLLSLLCSITSSHIMSRRRPSLVASWYSGRNMSHSTPWRLPYHCHTCVHFMT